MKKEKRTKKIKLSSRAREILMRVFVGVVVVMICCGAVAGYLNTTINYTLTEYLSDDAKSIQGLNKVKEEFGGSSYMRVMVENIEIVNASTLKSQFSEVKGVKYTLWLDDMVMMVIEPIQDDIQSFVDKFQTTMEGINADFEMPEEVSNFVKLVSEGAQKQEILRFLDENYIVLEAIDLVINYYFDGAIKLTDYYDSKAQNALIEVYFSEDDYSDLTFAAIDNIKNICSTKGLSASYDGSAITSKSTRETTLNEILLITAAVVPLILIILLFATGSFGEPILYVLVIGLSVVINMGTNFIFELFGILNGISFITNGMTAALQMALSIDYSVFILHKYHEECKTIPDKNLALKSAMKKSFLPIASSCLTTAAGFLAMVFMKFGIGRDIGFVFVKGILISFICALVFMPLFIKLLDKFIEKTRHKCYMPTGRKTSKYVIKFSVPIVILMIVLGGLSYIEQNKLQFIYGESSISSSAGTQSYEDAQRIENAFDIYNPIIIIIPKSLRSYTATNELNKNDNEQKIIDEISNITTETNKSVISGIMSYRSIVKPGLESFIPTELISNFDSENYTMIMVKVNAKSETQDAFSVYEQISKILSKNSPDFFITGSTVAAYDLKEIIEEDYKLTNILAIVAIFIIIALAFKSLLVPLLLVATIEIGIFINMAIVALSGTQVAFLGYLAVSLIQLGATIDYAILYCKNYFDARKTLLKRPATVKAMRKSTQSILTSALILFVAGYSMGLISSVQGVVDIGLMIGRGALISGALVLFVLPALFLMCDKYIRFTSLKCGFLVPPKPDKAETATLVETVIDDSDKDEAYKNEAENNTDEEDKDDD